MKQRYSKIYFEKYAALTLHQYFHISEEQIIQADMPDLRIPVLNMGIEVTQAIKDDISIQKKQLYSSYVMNPFDMQELFNVHTDDMQKYLMNIDDAIQRKIGKSKNYITYKYNGLYIFTHCISLTYEIMNAFFKQHAYENIFYRYIYLNSIDHMFIYDCYDHQLNEYQYELKDLIAYNQISLLYEEYKNEHYNKEWSNAK